MTKQPWKQAATLILLQRGSQLPGSSRHGANMLMLERSSQSKFFPSACVFPGGVSAQVDYSTKWQDILQKCSKVSSNQREFGIHGVNQNLSERPPMLCDDDNTPITKNIAYRLCAIRETFEESGILLYKSVNEHAPANFDESHLREWRDKVNKDDNAFLSLFQEYDLVPDIWSLYEWTNWLTPTHMGSRRYDTMFYVAFVGESLEAEHDDKEVVSSKWYSSKDLLDAYYTDKLMLAPPQVFEVCRFRHPSLLEWESLQHHVTERATMGCERWLPVRYDCQDGVISVLPGDDLYPAEPDMDGTGDILSLDQTVKESRQSCKKLHRMELIKAKNKLSCLVACTIEPKFGHIPPC